MTPKLPLQASLPVSARARLPLAKGGAFPAPHLVGGSLTTLDAFDAFTASLERSADEHPPSKARRIAALLPQIAAALAEGSSRAHIVKALLAVGVEVTPNQLSNVMSRLRRQQPGTEGSAAVLAPVPGITSVSTLAAAAARPVAGRAPSQFGSHDPRLLDEVMRSTPDMKALAKLAPTAPRTKP
jgi:hypothetical protein